MKEVVYIETTIVSYLVARPSRDLVLAAHQQLTQDWWRQERQTYDCITSTEVVREAALGDAEMSRLRLDALRELELVQLTADAEIMAGTFLQGGHPAARNARGCAASGTCRAQRGGLPPHLELPPSGKREHFEAPSERSRPPGLEAAAGLHTAGIDGRLTA